MNVFGVGTGEIIFILIIAMIIMGPERMVKLSGQMGRLLVKLRRETDSVTKEFREAFSSEISEIQDAAKDLQGIAQDLKVAATDVESAAKDVTDVVNQPANAATPKPAATVHRPATGTVQKPTKPTPAAQAAAGAAFLDGETVVEETIVRVATDDQPDGVTTEEDAEAYVVDAGELDDTSVVLDVAELVTEEEELPAEALVEAPETPDVLALNEVELSDASPSKGDSHDA